MHTMLRQRWKKLIIACLLITMVSSTGLPSYRHVIGAAQDETDLLSWLDLVNVKDDDSKPGKNSVMNDTSLSNIFEESELEAIMIPKASGGWAENATEPSISEDGRWLVFESTEALVYEDTNRMPDIYLFDRETATVTLVSADGFSAGYKPEMSMDGRFILFASNASSFQGKPLKEKYNLYFYDRVSQSIQLAAEGVGIDSYRYTSHSISADGKFIAYWSYTPNAWKQDLNGTFDVFYKDMVTGNVKRLTENGNHYSPYFMPEFGEEIVLSPEGKYAAFTSDIFPSNNFNDKIKSETVNLYDVKKDTNEGDFVPDFSGVYAITAEGRYLHFLYYDGWDKSFSLNWFDQSRKINYRHFDFENTIKDFGSMRSLPVSSADGKTLVYTATPALNQNNELYVLDLDTRGNFNLSDALSLGASSSGESSAPYITRNGKLLVFSHSYTIDSQEQGSKFNHIYLKKLKPRQVDDSAWKWTDHNGIKINAVGGSYAHVSWDSAVYEHAVDNNPVNYMVQVLSKDEHSDEIARIADITTESQLLIEGLEQLESYRIEVYAGNLSYQFHSIPLIRDISTSLREHSVPLPASNVSVTAEPGKFKVQWDLPEDWGIAAARIAWRKSGTVTWNELPLQPLNMYAEYQTTLFGAVKDVQYDIRILLIDADGKESHPVLVQTTGMGEHPVELISVSAAGVQMTPHQVSYFENPDVEHALLAVDISDNGRYVVFSGEAGGLLSSLENYDTSIPQQIYLYDRSTSALQLISRGQSGDAIAPSLHANTQPRISGNGRFIVYRDNAPDDLSSRILLHDRDSDEDGRLDEEEDVSQLVIAHSDATQELGQVVISDDGSTIVFVVHEVADQQDRVYRYERATGSTNEILINNAKHIESIEISGDGKHVSILSSPASSSVLTEGDGDTLQLIRLSDGTSETVVPPGERESAFYRHVSLSDDARYIVFNYGDALSFGLYMLDRAATGQQAYQQISTMDPNYSSEARISGDGRTILYTTGVQIQNGPDYQTEYYTQDVFFHSKWFTQAYIYRIADREHLPISVSYRGKLSYGDVYSPAISDDGTVAVFASAGANLLAGDHNFYDDVFVTTLTGAISELDTTPPVWPDQGELHTSETTFQSVKLSWPKAEDLESGISFYRIFNGPNLTATATAGQTSLTLDGLQPETSYLFSVEAVDAAGNVTKQRLSTEVTTDILPVEQSIVIIEAEARAAVQYQSSLGIGDELSVKMKGTPGLLGSADIQYMDLEGRTHTEEMTLTEIIGSPGNYHGNFPIVEGISHFISAVAKLRNAEHTAVLSAKLNNDVYVGGSVQFQIPENLAERTKDGGYLKLTGGEGIYASLVLDGSNTYSLRGLPAHPGQGTEYVVELVTADGIPAELTSGTVLVKRAQTITYNLIGEVPIILKAQVLFPQDKQMTRAYMIVESEQAVVFAGYVPVNREHDWVEIDNLLPDQVMDISIIPDAISVQETSIQWVAKADTANELIIPLQPRKLVTVSGYVKNEHELGIAGAQVIVNQSIGNKQSQVSLARTDAQGYFRLSAYEGAAVIQARSDSNNWSSVDQALQLDSIQEIVLRMYRTGPALVNLNIYTKHIGGQWIGPLDLDWRVLAHYHVYSYAKLHPGNQLELYSQWLPGQKISLCVNGKESNLPEVCGSTVLDENREGSIEIRLEEAGAQVKGLVEEDGGFPSSVSASLYLINNGTWSSPKQFTIPASFELNLNQAGTYYALFKNPRSGYTASLSFHVEEQQSVQLGQIILNKPGAFDGQPSSQAVHLSPSEVMPGGLLQMRMTYKNTGSARGIAGQTKLIVPIPTGTKLVEDGVLINGKAAAVAYRDDGSAVIDIGDVQYDESGQALLTLRLDPSFEEAVVTVHPRMSYIWDGAERVDWLIRSSAKVTHISLEVQERLSQPEVTVSGLAPAYSSIRIYDGARGLGETVASPNGIWSKTISLTEDNRKSVHRLRAEASVHQGEANMEFVSAERLVIYDPDYPVLTEVRFTQMGEREVVFDPRQGIAIFPYVYVPGQPFLIKAFFNNSSLVSNVRVTLGDQVVAMTRHDDHYIAILNQHGNLSIQYDVREQSLTDSIISLENRIEMISDQAQSLENVQSDLNYDEDRPHSMELRQSGQLVVGDEMLDMNMHLTTEVVEQADVPEDGETVSNVSMDYMESDGELVYQITGYIAEDVYKEMTNALSLQEAVGILRTARSATSPQEFSIKPASVISKIKVTAKVTWKFGKGVVGEALSIIDVIDTGERFLRMDRAYKQIQQYCGPGAAQKYSTKVNKIRVHYGAMEAAMWGSYVLLAAASVGTAGAAAVVVTGAVAFTMVYDNSIDKTIDGAINQLMEDINRDSDCHIPPIDDPFLDILKDKAPLAKPVYIYDPSGYVFEVEESNRIAGVTASVFYMEDSRWKLWDAEWFGQINPQTTNREGRYAWDVPEGLWKVVYEKEGYQLAQSEALRVLPPHTDVNIAMVSNLPAEALYAKLDVKESGKAQIHMKFDRHVDRDSFNKRMLQVIGVTQNGLEAELRIDDVVATKDSVLYKGRQVSREFTIMLEEVQELHALESIRLFMNSGIQTYNGIPMKHNKELAVEIKDLPPARVAEVSIVASTNGMALSWIDPKDPDLAAIRILYSESGQPSSVKELIVASGAQFAIISDMKDATDYTIVIQAVDEAGLYSEYAYALETAAIESRRDVIPPSTVEDAVVRAEANKLHVSWKELADDSDVDKITVSWKETNSNQPTVVAEVNKGSDFYTITDVKELTAYEIIIRTVDAAGNLSIGSLLYANTIKSDSGGVPGIDPPGENPPGTKPTPEEALPNQEAIEVTEASAASQIQLPDRYWRSLSSSYNVQFDSEAADDMQKNTMLTLPYVPQRLLGANPLRMGIYRYNPLAEGRWEYIGGKVNIQQQTIEAPIAENGLYAVLLYTPLFADITSHWSRQQIEIIISRHLVKGVGNHQFAPDRRITRAEIVQLLVRLLSMQELRNRNHTDNGGKPILFHDVKEKDWYYEAVKTAASWGLVIGSDGLFRPNDTVTREELAVLISRVLERIGKDIGPLPSSTASMDYDDYSAISNWAQQAFTVSLAAGFIEGMGNRKLEPQEAATRAQAAVIIYRILHYLQMIEED